MGKSLRGKRLKRLGLFWVGVFLSFSLWAQTGVICGTVTDANDESDRDGMRIVIDVKRDANASVVLNKLYTMTELF